MKLSTKVGYPRISYEARQKQNLLQNLEASKEHCSQKTWFEIAKFWLI